MNIGIVTTWMERGAAYVSKNYMQLLESEGNNVFIYARGGEKQDKSSVWNTSKVFWGERNKNTVVSKRNMFKWISQNKLDVILFNEQKYFPILVYIKEKFPNVKICAYVDYYKEDTIPYFDIYDFVICNTYRHYDAMKTHPQRFYLKWGVDTNVFVPKNEVHKELTFFHSVGMSNRKGTNILVDAFVEGELYKVSKLILHTQIPIEKVCRYNKTELANYNVDVIEKTVTAPGLYHLGDVYVYPTTLDGLGLTLYEALACGLPVITTDNAPMNEPINNEVGKLVKVQEYHSRADGYFWPLSIAEKNDLIVKMKWYVDNKQQLDEMKKKVRYYAEQNYKLSDRSNELNLIMKNAEVRCVSPELSKKILDTYKREKMLTLRRLFDQSHSLFWIKELLYRIKG